VALICFARLRVALVSAVYLIVLLSGCANPYGSIGEASAIQLAPGTYRVLFSPTGYISWDLAYRAALLRCAELTIENGYRYFAVEAIDNYSSATSFAIPVNGQGGRFYDARTAYNPPHSPSISYWPLPALTIKLLRDPVPGVTLDAKVIQRRTTPI